MATLDEDFTEGSGADYIDGSETVRAFFEIPPDGLIDIDEDLQVVAIDNYVRSSHRAQAEGILSYLQDKVESGALNHVKGLRGEDHKGYKSKLYLVLEVTEWIEKYYKELAETDGRTVPRNGVLSIDGHRAFALPTYLNASGWTRDESRFTLRRILETGIEPCEGDFFSGTTPDADGILRQSRRHKVFVFLEDDVDWLLPQCPDPDGMIELKLSCGNTMPAIAPLLVFPIKAQRLRLARELKAAGYKPIANVQVTNPDTTKKASKLDVYQFNEAVAGIIERVKRESHKKHR